MDVKNAFAQKIHGKIDHKWSFLNNLHFCFYKNWDFHLVGILPDSVIESLWCTVL